LILLLIGCVVGTVRLEEVSTPAPPIPVGEGVRIQSTSRMTTLGPVALPEGSWPSDVDGVDCSVRGGNLTVFQDLGVLRLRPFPATARCGPAGQEVAFRISGP
jgi:hypothetical protein